jgi:hypothetical protein
MRVCHAGFAFARVSSSAGSSVGSAAHSSHASVFDRPSDAASRMLVKTSPLSSGVGGVPISQICGFGRADIVELIDTHAGIPRICASSSSRQSEEKPREPETVRALNWITAPLLNLMNSRLSAFITLSMRSARAGLASICSRNFANVSRAVSCACAEMTIFFSPNSSAPARARATISCDLPFCRGALSPTCFAAHVPSDRSPIAAWRTASCHGSSTTPNDADRSATSSQELALVGGGSTRTLGGACSPSSATLGDLVNGVTNLLGRGQLVDLLESDRPSTEGRQWA